MNINEFLPSKLTQAAARKNLKDTAYGAAIVSVVFIVMALLMVYPAILKVLAVLIGVVAAIAILWVLIAPTQKDEDETN